MKGVLFIITLCLTGSYVSVHAQKIPRKLVALGGNSHASENYYFSWSVGEAIVGTAPQGTHILTQGFQQPSLILKEPHPKPEIDEVRVFPNPVNDRVELTVKFDVKHLRSYRIEVISIEGRVMLIKDIEFNESMFWEEKISFTGYSQGLYLIHVYSSDRRIDKLFKIEKLSIKL